MRTAEAELIATTVLDSVYHIVSKAEELSLDYIFLFGSTARGTNRVDSDIDLLVLIRDGNPRSFATYLCDLIEEHLFYEHPYVHVTVASTDEFFYLIDKIELFHSISLDMKPLWGFESGYIFNS